MNTFTTSNGGGDSIRSKAFKMVVILCVLLTFILSACDNGGTFGPDAGCIGQGSSAESCIDNLQSLSDSGNQAINDIMGK